MTDSFLPDRPVICPYDSNHSIAQSRFQRHIIKCSKNFPPNYRLCCPYNETHRLAKSEMRKHVNECPDRKYVEPNIYEDNSSCSSVVNYKMEDRSVIHCEESWDKEDGTLFEVSSIRDLDDSVKPLMRVNDYEPSVEFSSKPSDESRIIMRPPLSRAVALMMDESGDSAVEDIESVKSFVGMGRGKLLANRNNESMLPNIGKERSSSP